MLHITPLFTILKSPYPMGQPAHLKKITLVQGRGHPIQRGQASKASTGSSSNWFNNGNHKDPPRSNKPGPSKVLAEAPTGPPQALPSIF